MLEGDIGGRRLRGSGACKPLGAGMRPRAPSGRQQASRRLALRRPPSEPPGGGYEGRGLLRRTGH